MSDQYSLSKFATANTFFPYESYVMCYLRALSQQPTYGGDHPLNIQLHLTPADAYFLMRSPNEVSKLEKLLNCKREEVFERLRDFIDEWDGVRVPTSFEIADLVEADSETLLLNNEAHQIAARYLKCTPEGVLGTLFDPVQIYKDVLSVSGGARFANNDVYKLLRHLNSQPALRQKIISNFYLRDWWEVLENWVRTSIQADLATTLSQQTGNTVSKAFVLRELFRLVKISLGMGSTQNKPYSKLIQATRLGMVLPEETSKFWQTLKDFSTDDSSNLKLDALDQANIAKNSTEANAREALRLADTYMQTYVQPLQHELGQVDMLGMIALKHRFQGIVDELLSSALHYASLDSDAKNPFSYIQDAIRYYCHGEYKIALGNLLYVPFLSLEQMGVEPPHVTNRHVEVDKDTAIILFSAEDNSFLNLSFLKSTTRPPRTVAGDELIVALQFDNRAMEILSLNKLDKVHIEQIKAAFPKTIGGLIDNGYSLADRIMKTPIPVSSDRQKINEALKEQIKYLVQALLLSGTPFSLGRLISYTDIFNRVPKPLSSDKTLVQTYSRESLATEIMSEYKKNGIKVTPVNGA